MKVCVTAMPVRTPVPVVCVNASEHRVFPSLSSASKYVSDCEVAAGRPHQQPSINVIKHHLRLGLEYHGWRFLKGDQFGGGEPVPTTDTAVDKAPPAAEPTVLDHITFAFGPEAAEIFRNKAVRVTPDKRVSVFDVIQVVTDGQNPRDTYANICQADSGLVSKASTFKFPGAGQRLTPVIDMEGMLSIINLLPGANAARFRAGGARLLVRYMGGDESLVPQQSVALIAKQEGQTIPDGHSTGAEGQPLHKAAHPSSSSSPKPEFMYKLMSPRLEGVNLTLFAKKPVCYLLPFVYDGKSYIKFGFSTDILKRLKCHKREIPGLVGVWFVIEAPMAVETAFKEYMRCEDKLVSAWVGNKMQTELLTGITEHGAEMQLCKLVEAHQENSSLDLCKLERNVEMEKLKVEAIKVEKGAEVEKEKLRMEAERDKQILQMIQQNPSLAPQLLPLLQR